MNSVGLINPLMGDTGLFLAGYVCVDIANRDLGGYVTEAKEAVKNRVNSRGVIRLSGADSMKICSAWRSV